MSDVLIALVAAASGVALKTAWTAWIDKRKAIELEVWKVRAEELEKRLSHFYWPLYLRLQRDNVVWNRILDRENHSDQEKQKLAREIEQGVLLPNHAEIVKIIEGNVHLAALDKEFEQEILAYLRHIDVYRSIRTAGINDKDPVYFGEPYPSRLFSVVETRLRQFQKEYDSLLSMQSPK